MDLKPFFDLAASGYAPRSLLDIGAHLGEFSKTFVSIFPGCAAVVVEPNPHCGDALSRLPFEFHGFAASAQNGEAELHLTSEWLQSTGASLYRENTHFFRDEVLRKTTVQCRRLDDIFPNRRFDVVKIDVQGAELDVLRGGKSVIAKADYVLVEVSLVNYNLGGAKAEDIFSELSELGFNCSGVLEFHRWGQGPDSKLMQMDFLFENKARIVSRARGSQNVLALRQAAGLSKPDPAALEALVTQDLARGDVASALRVLLESHEKAPQAQNFLPLLKSAMTPAADQINAHVGAGDWTQAAAIAVPLANLLPRYVPAQRAAMIASANLSQAEPASEFAQRLLAIEPSDAEAVDVAQRARIVVAAVSKERENARVALFAPPSRHPLLTLRDYHDAVTSVLIREPDDAALYRVGEYVKRSRKLDVPTPHEPDLAAWLKHFRVAMDAMDPSRILGPLPQGSLGVPDAFATRSGDAVSQAEFLRRISQAGPQAVFFVAADVKYVGLYADHYIKSVVANCDVPYAIVLHVIGGAGHLHEIAPTLAGDDEHVFLTGDRFDAAAVTTKCFDTPPKGMYPHPAAHFQSVRFQSLGWLLEAVKRPVFVSDIDLLLQRGVADLLTREAGSDFVLNENSASLSCGSRYTANLVMLNPTTGAAYFAAALKTYLDETLSKPEVSRWIDQFGLLMARHRIRRDRPEVKIGYFDTNSDINNLMYRTFEKNPFRFLSLYHGFDMDSLKSAA